MSEYMRSVTLDIGTEGSTGRRFQGFRISASVDMDQTSAPHKALIRAYNLPRDTMGVLVAPEGVVRLYAGYSAPLQIFRGSPVRDGVRETQQGVDRILEIEAQDGGRQLKRSRVNLSFSTPTTLQQAWDAVSAEVGIPLGTVRLGALATAQLTQGVMLNGPARDVMDRLADSLGVLWYVSDGALQVISADDDFGTTAIVFSSTSGNLIGSPEPTDNGIEMVGLLAPGMRPGQPFRIQGTERHDGDYVAQRVVFSLDSGWERDFYVTIRGRTRRAA